MMHLPVNVPNFPPALESVGRAVSAESLRAAGAAGTEPAVLLGLCFLARSGDAVRQELADLAVQRNSDYAPITALLTLMLDHVDSVAAEELVRKDPDNSIGHYVLGALFHIGNNPHKAIEEFRRAVGCAEMRFYGPVLAEALFKALIALNLHGADRVCALSWATSRWTDFSSIAVQPIYRAISELARTSPPATRLELTETLQALAGHLFVTNFTNRWFALRAVEAALILRAGFEPESNLATRNGFAAAVYAWQSQCFPFPGSPSIGSTLRIVWLSFYRAVFNRRLPPRRPIRWILGEPMKPD